MNMRSGLSQLRTCLPKIGAVLAESSFEAIMVCQDVISLQGWLRDRDLLIKKKLWK